MNCGKSCFVDADHTCPRANKIVCRSSYKINKKAFHRFSVSVPKQIMQKAKLNPKYIYIYLEVFLRSTKTLSRTETLKRETQVKVI